MPLCLITLRLATNRWYMAQEQKKALWSPAVKKSLGFKTGLSKHPYRLNCDFKGDGLGTRGKSLKFMVDPSFDQAWIETAETYREATGEDAPDIRWRAH